MYDLDFLKWSGRKCVLKIWIPNSLLISNIYHLACVLVPMLTP